MLPRAGVALVPTLNRTDSNTREFTLVRLASSAGFFGSREPMGTLVFSTNLSRDFLIM